MAGWDREKAARASQAAYRRERAKRKHNWARTPNGVRCSRCHVPKQAGAPACFEATKLVDQILTEGGIKWTPIGPYLKDVGVRKLYCNYPLGNFEHCDARANWVMDDASWQSRGFSTPRVACDEHKKAWRR